MIKEEFVDSVVDLLDAVGDGEEEALRANADKIDALADYSRQTDMFKRSSHLGEDAFKDMTPYDIYNYMIIKIVESPTSFHRDSSVILIIPYLSDALKR